MHGPKSLIQDTFKLFTLSMNDKSGLTVQKIVMKSQNIQN